MAKRPTSELVAKAYAKAVLADAGLSAALVATTLPAVESWAATGAVQVESIVGTVVRDNDIRDMVVSYGGWAARPGSDKPPYGQANELLEVLRASAFVEAPSVWLLELEPAGIYEPVLVQSATPVTEPRRIPDQDTSRAHYSMDFRLFWVVA